MIRDFDIPHSGGNYVVTHQITNPPRKGLTLSGTMNYVVREI